MAKPITVVEESLPEVGGRIDILWPTDEMHYSGTAERAIGRSGHKFHVRYDDGDEFDENLNEVFWRHSAHGDRPASCWFEPGDASEMSLIFTDRSFVVSTPACRRPVRRRKRPNASALSRPLQRACKLVRPSSHAPADSPTNQQVGTGVGAAGAAKEKVEEVGAGSSCTDWESGFDGTVRGSCGESVASLDGICMSGGGKATGSGISAACGGAGGAASSSSGRQELGGEAWTTEELCAPFRKRFKRCHSSYR